MLRSDGYFALATDIGETPEHPCSLVEADVVAALRGCYREIEYRCSADVPSSRPADMEVPILVFQGEKNAPSLFVVGGPGHGR